MLDFNLEYYRAFYYVAQLGSVSRAADALFLSQPNITRTIKQLEKHLGCQLFSRVSRGMRMTNEGRIVFEHVEKAFGHLLEAEKTLRRMADFDTGIINIGATETALYYFLLPIIESFRKQYPKILINFSGSTTPETIRMVEEGKADLAVVVSPVLDRGGLVVTTALTFSDIFVASPSFVENENLRDRVLTAKDACAFPIVAVEKGTTSRAHIDLWFKEQGIFFEPDYSVRTPSTVLSLVKRHLAIGILPELFVKDLLYSGEVCEVIMKQPIPPRQILSVHKDASQMTALGRHFVNFMHSHRVL
jgi:DNA-binding transcriptional LysR family regulator